MKLCQIDFYCWYNDPPTTYMNDVFHGYWNLLNIMSNVVVHESTPILNTSLEELNFQIFGTSIMMHCHCPQMAFYVLVTQGAFQ